MNGDPTDGDKSVLGPFIGMIGRHWPAMALGVLLSLLAALAAIGLLSLSGWFIAATAYAGLNAAAARAFNFFLPSIGVRLFAMSRTAARYAERVIAHDATFRILETLRSWCYARLEPLSPARLGRYHSGDLLTRIITDIDTLDNLYLRVLSPSVVAAVTIAMVSGFLLHYHPLAAWFCAAVFIAAAVGIPAASNAMARATARQLNEQTARMRSVLVDGIHGLAALLTCNAEHHYLQRVRRRHNSLVRIQERMSHIAGASSALMTLAGGLAVTGILYIGVGTVAEGNLTGPRLALMALAAMAAFEILLPLPGAFQYLGQTRKAAHRLLRTARTRPAVTFPAVSDQAPRDHGIEFDHVSFTFGGTNRAALSSVSFRIAPGRRIAVMGATGAGKSTLLYLLARFEDPDNGEIRLGRRSLAAYSEKTLRRSICIVDQRAHIFNGTLYDNLILANPQADSRDLEQALAAVELTDFVASLSDGLNTWVGEAGRTLSGGQSRRLAIARALLTKASIWAFDEPTEGLDHQTANAMMRNLLDLGKDKTVVMITHRPEAVERMDQVILLHQGSIADMDAPAALKERNPGYRRLISARKNP